MKISYNWLKEYLTIDLRPEEVSEALTSVGLEVEELIKYESVKGGLQGVVTGEVLSCVKHPNADRLSLTTVDVGLDEALSIVCGAPNVAAGQKVLVATVGTMLYSGEESFQIKKSKIRGELSEGMICAEDELGLGTSHEGIMVLDSQTQIGKPATDYFPVETDYIFEVAITPNRADATSHIGVARDLAALLNFRNKSRNYQLQIPSVDDFEIKSNDLDIAIEIVDEQACPRYSGISIKNIKVGPSPQWLQNKLNSVGLRPINNIVDITNFVLLETGQPLHAFDAAKVNGNKVVVQTLAEGTSFVTLDEVERKLGANDLMICNVEAPMCIAGVFGGFESGVSEETTAIFLESACFDSRYVRRTARKHGLHTDASFRFERGSDPEITIFALKRAAILIEEIAGGVVASEIKDLYPGKQQAAEVNLSFDYLNRIAGQQIATEVAVSILTDLGCTLLHKDEKQAKFKVPPYKVDVYRPADLVEEVLRIYGYDRIEIPEKLNASVNISEKNDPDKLQHAVADMLAAMGLQEIMNNSLTKSAYTEKHPAFEPSAYVAMLNPLSKDLDVLRQSLLFGGLETIAYNQNRKLSDLKLFEFGKTYQLQADKADPADALKKYKEQMELAIFMSGLKELENWNSSEKAVDFYDLRLYVEAVFTKLRLPFADMQLTDIKDGMFEYGICGQLNGIELFRFGLLTRQSLQQFDVKKAVYYAEIKWEEVLALIPNQAIKFKSLPKYPSVRRDLALVLDSSVRFSDIVAIAQKTETKILRDIHLFDVYEGDKIAAGKKSYAVSFTLMDEEKTLTDKLIEKTMSRLLLAFEQQLGAVLR